MVASSCSASSLLAIGYSLLAASALLPTGFPAAAAAARPVCLSVEPVEGILTCALEHGHSGHHTRFHSDLDTWVEWPNTDRDAVDRPRHYFAGGFECGELVDALLPRWTASGLDPHRLASAFEYLFRCGAKDNPQQDAEKALNYLHRALYGRWFRFTSEDKS